MRDGGERVISDQQSVTSDQSGGLDFLIAGH